MALFSCFIKLDQCISLDRGGHGKHEFHIWMDKTFDSLTVSAGSTSTTSIAIQGFGERDRCLCLPHSTLTVEEISVRDFLFLYLIREDLLGSLLPHDIIEHPTVI